LKPGDPGRHWHGKPPQIGDWNDNRVWLPGWLSDDQTHMESGMWIETWRGRSVPESAGPPDSHWNSSMQTWIEQTPDFQTYPESGMRIETRRAPPRCWTRCPQTHLESGIRIETGLALNPSTTRRRIETPLGGSAKASIGADWNRT